MKILICGIGAIGSNLTARLVSDLKGQHEITVLDRDSIESRNVQAGTQFYTPDQVGLPKVEALQFNIYKWYQKEIDIRNENFCGESKFGDYNLVIDCFDNYSTRNLIQVVWKRVNQINKKVNFDSDFFHLLHLGFSNEFTFAIEWAENYTVPSDIIGGIDICEMQGASSFVNKVSSLGSLVIQEFLSHQKKIEIIGNKLTHTVVK